MGGDDVEMICCSQGNLTISETVIVMNRSAFKSTLILRWEKSKCL